MKSPAARTTTPTFARWLRAQTHRHDPVGDLARDAVTDLDIGCLGRLITPARLAQHAQTVHDASAAAVAALDRAVGEWQASS